MPKDHLALALAIGPTFLTTLVNWIESILLRACHAVLVPECGPAVSVAILELTVCFKWPDPNHSDFCALW